MNKKRIIIAGVVAISIVIVICICLFFICKNAEESVDENIIDTEEASNEVTNNVVYSMEESTYDIAPSEGEEISQDGISIENIHVNVVATQMEITTTLKNNTEEAVNGYMIRLELLNEAGEVIATSVKNSEDVIEAGGNAEMVTYATVNGRSAQAVKVRIVSLEKHTIEQAVEEGFDEMLPEE